MVHRLAVLVVLLAVLIVTPHVMAADSSAPQAVAPQNTILPLSAAEKRQHIKRLEKALLATVGWRKGRYGFLTLSRGPRTDRLYRLHKTLTDTDRKLLAEMYLNFRYETGGGDRSRHLDEALHTLLAMCGEAVIRDMNEIIDTSYYATVHSKASRCKVKFIKKSIERQYWSDLPEYKKDLAAACDADEGLACRRLGYLYEYGGVVKKEPGKAKMLYEKACAGGELLACVGLGRLYDSGLLGERDEGKARALYESVCAVDGAMCNAIGKSYQLHISVKFDHRKVIEYYAKACHADYAEGCMNLADFYSQGRDIEQDYSRAKKYYKKACELGNIISCGEYEQLNN